MTKILIAEDEADIRELIKITLSFGGFEVVAAEDGRRAVELAHDGPFDLIMMDIQMPYMDGYQACREIKKIPALRDVPVVFLSAKGQSSEVREGLGAGAIDYMLKPFAPDELIERINQILMNDGKPGQVA
ncbi:MAG: two-component system alkaline phosphatase synthesis response regulator PhoP [Cellvibrionaceae bacterium]|jgi:two-component system alkaline phosphatase synthesis response regulator PhoP